jgi:hypothetical protein
VSVIDQEIEDFISHYGKKGMKWGARKQFGAKNRALNKASRDKDRRARDKQIDLARSRTRSDKTFAARIGLTDTGSKSHTEYKQAVAKFKQDREKVGSREARKVLNKAAKKRVNDIQNARLAKSGKETVLSVLVNTGKVPFQSARA